VHLEHSSISQRRSWAGSGLSFSAALFLENADTCPEARLQPIVDANIAAGVGLDAGRFEPDPGSVGDAPRGDEQIAGLEPSIARGSPQCQHDLITRAALNGESLRPQQEFPQQMRRSPSLRRWSCSMEPRRQSPGAMSGLHKYPYIAVNYPYHGKKTYHTAGKIPSNLPLEREKWGRRLSNCLQHLHAAATLRAGGP
jgi:hypothetical protein